MVQEDHMALWRKVFKLTFDAWYAEMLLAAWLGTWLHVDSFVALGTAVTASGSAIAGWALWNESGWREVWVALAGATALASIVHTKLGIGSRLDALQRSRSDFLDVRSDAKTLLDRMDLGMPTDKASEIYFALQERYKKAEKEFQSGLLEPSKEHKQVIQERVAKELSAYTEGGNGNERQ